MPRRLEAAARSGAKDVNLGRVPIEVIEAPSSHGMLDRIVREVRQGLAPDPYAARGAAVAGIAQSDLDAFVAVERARHASGEMALRIVREGLRPEQTLASAATQQLVNAVYSVAYWQKIGDRAFEAVARREVQRRSRVLGVSAKALMGLPVAIAVSSEGATLLSQARQAELQRQRARWSTPTQQPTAPDRSPKGPHAWWTGQPAAYLDLARRKLPELLEGLPQRGAKRLRLWHVGFEDTSQTFLLAALVDEAIARTAARRPEMRPMLDALAVEIIASDHMQSPRRRGRRFRFNEAERVQFGPKTDLLLRERGAADEARARQEIAALERSLDATAGTDPKQLEELVRRGKVAAMLGRLFSLAPRIGVHERNDSVHFSYALRPHSWRVEDTIDGKTLNADVTRRTIRFVRSDLTRESATADGTADLVLATHVLPYIATYGGDNALLSAAVKNLARARAEGAPLVVDENSAHGLKEQALEALVGADSPLWVTKSNRLDDRTLGSYVPYSP